MNFRDVDTKIRMCSAVHKQFTFNISIVSHANKDKIIKIQTQSIARVSSLRQFTRRRFETFIFKQRNNLMFFATML